MGITTIGSDLTPQELTGKIVAQANEGKIAILTDIIKKGELPVETAKFLLESREGTIALAKAYKGNEEKAVFLADTLDYDDRIKFIDSVLFELASIVKNLESTTGRQKINSMKSTIESINDFLISLISTMNTDKFLEVIDDLGGSNLIYALMEESFISINEEIEFDADDFYGDDENSMGSHISAEAKLESGITINPEELTISGKYSDEIQAFLEELFENDETYYNEILRGKLSFQEKNSINEIIESKELDLTEKTPKQDTVYMLIKAKVEEYEDKYKDITEEMDGEIFKNILPNLNKGKSGKTINPVGITKKEINKILVEEGETDDFDIF